MSESYTSRPMWLAKETTYAIAQDGLSMRDLGGASRTIPWHKIDSVRLHWTQQRNQSRFYHCTITLRGDRFAAARFSQARFEGVLSFVDQSAAYNDFVRAFAARASVEAPQAKFVHGPDEMERMFIAGGAYAAAAGCWIFAAMILSGYFGGEPEYDIAAFAGAVGLGLCWLGWKLYQWNGSKPIDPRALPSDVLAPV